jgi:hypothetical protein
LCEDCDEPEHLCRCQPEPTEAEYEMAACATVGGLAL